MSNKPVSKKAKSVPQGDEGSAFDNVIDFAARRAVVPLAEQVNTRELCSIKAMTAYVAHEQKVREETVRVFVETQFGVDTIEQLNRDDFERVITFLVDLRCDLLLN